MNHGPVSGPATGTGAGDAEGGVETSVGVRPSRSWENADSGMDLSWIGYNGHTLPDRDGVRRENLSGAAPGAPRLGGRVQRTR